MYNQGISPETAQFICSHFESLGQMEVLLLLHGSPGSSYSAARINDELRSNLDSVQRQLEALVKSGFVVVEGDPAAYGYVPASADLADSVDALSEAYRNYRERIIELIYSRQQQMRNFSNSFRLRRDRDPNG